MEILSHKNHQALLDYLPRIKSSLAEWVFVDVRLTNASSEGFNIQEAAELIHSLFGDKEGKLYIGNDREMIMLLRWGRNHNPDEIAKRVEARLPAGTCEVHAYAPTPEGISTVEMLITYKTPVKFADTRRLRQEKIVLVADDDMYMRMLIKDGIGKTMTVHEVDNGIEIAAAYKKYSPDILFLDIHMPHLNGTDALKDILILDPEAYIIMLSADSSRENVAQTTQQGAKGFMTKPFTKAKLQEYVGKCPTVSG